MEPLDELYFQWLVDQVDSADTRYWHLLRQLFSTEFVWFVPNDDNRASDGVSLRAEWVANYPEAFDYDWIIEACSVLEMMIALARRLAFEAEGEPRGWFWRMINNLGLSACTDDIYSRDNLREVAVADVLNALVYRNYRANGRGGLFPLRNPDCDQREVEIWYQQSAYILENE